MNNYKPKKELPEHVIVAAYRTSPATSRDLAAHYGVSVNTIQAIIRAHLPAATIRDLRYVKTSRKNSRALRIRHGTNRPPLTPTSD